MCLKRKLRVITVAAEYSMSRENKSASDYSAFFASNVRKDPTAKFAVKQLSLKTSSSTISTKIHVVLPYGIQYCRFPDRTRMFVDDGK